MAQYSNDTLAGASGTGDVIDWPGGPGVFGCQGTFNSATFQLQFSLDGGTTWNDVPGAEMTIIAADLGAFQLAPCKLRISWSGGNGSTSVKVLVAPSWPGWWNDPTNLPAT